MGHAVSCFDNLRHVSDPALPMSVNGHRSLKRKNRQPTLRAAGIKQCKLIVGMDFTKSNTWTGQLSFNGQCLHDISCGTNPYIHAMSLVARTLNVSGANHLIRSYGFGDVAAAEDAVFSFFDRNEPAHGLNSLLERYQQIAPHVKLGERTSFAPLIRQAMRDVYNSGMKYHVLLIIADGQISRECLEDTKQAIREACAFPLSIVMVGVGDGPWTGMNLFDADLPERPWNNFHFLEFRRIVDRTIAGGQENQENTFQKLMLRALLSNCKHARGLTKNANKEEASRLMLNCSAHVPVVSPPCSLGSDFDAYLILNCYDHH